MKCQVTKILTDNNIGLLEFVDDEFGMPFSASSLPPPVKRAEPAMFMFVLLFKDILNKIPSLFSSKAALEICDL